jgi:tungstate transport system ATP-binding protein
MLERTAGMTLDGALADAVSVPGALMPMDVSGLTYEVEGKRLVDGIDLALEDGSLTVVMGPNGAGKSLLLRLLHGLIAPSSGAIRWGGAPMSAAIRKRQAMVFQRPVLLRRSVAANVDFALKLNGGAAAGRCDELLSLVGLIERRRQPARLLSGGEQQRLALARALATSPEVLLLDEPTASLDPASVAMIEDIARQARAGGTKIIFVTHDVSQARRLAEEVVFLDRGRLAEHASAADFFSNPVTAAAQAYLEGRIVV